MGVDDVIDAGRPSCNMRLITSVNDALTRHTSILPSRKPTFSSKSSHVSPLDTKCIFAYILFQIRTYSPLASLRLQAQ